VFGKNIEGGVVGPTQEDAATAVVSANLNRNYNFRLYRQEDKNFDRRRNQVYSMLHNSQTLSKA
jgi:hypothetical protein